MNIFSATHDGLWWLQRYYYRDDDDNNDNLFARMEEHKMEEEQVAWAGCGCTPICILGGVCEGVGSNVRLEIYGHEREFERLAMMV